jgi:hypothetical protein
MATEAYLQMIQAVVTRLASQSTTVKGWCVTVTGALLGFAATASTPAVAAIALYVICAFAILDAYYLVLERAYRDLYRRAATSHSSDWALDVAKPAVSEIRAALCSPVIAVLYGASLLVAMGVGTFLLVK